MSIAEICALDVGSIMAPDAVLWLWVTNYHMREAFEVLEAWGFEHKTILTWVKDRMGLGQLLRGQSEHCLMATRGKPIITLTDQTTVLQAPVRANSQKPDEFYGMVERLCPAPRYAELFACTARPGWDGHGDQYPAYDAEADAIGSYYDGIKAIGERVKAGAPVPEFMLSRRQQPATAGHVCHHPKGCRYSGCEGEGRCLIRSAVGAGAAP